MGKLKKRLLKFLAITLTASFLIQPGMTVIAEAAQAVKEIATNIGTLGEEEDSEDISAYSLLPLEHRYADLVLNSYSKEELKAMSLETIFENLRGEGGSPISKGSSAAISFEEDDYQIVELGETIDLSREDLSEENRTSYYMEMIIGNGKQLDSSNIRYTVTVYISDVQEKISYHLYTMNRNSVPMKEIKYSRSSILGDIDIPVMAVSFITSDSLETNYYLGIDSDISSSSFYKNIKVDVYPMEKFLQYYQDGTSLEGMAITDQILNQDDMDKEGGVLGTYTSPSSSENFHDVNNLFCIVYTNTETGKVLGYHGLLFTVEESQLYNINSGQILICEDSGEMKDITTPSKTYKGTMRWGLDLLSDSNGVKVKYPVETIYYDLIKGHSSEEEYYYVLDSSSNEHVEKVVLGHFDTLKEALDAEDITDQLLLTDENQKSYGYKTNFCKDIIITVFFDNNTFSNYKIDIYATNSTGDIDIEKPNGLAPAVGKLDPYFRVTGVSGSAVDVYIVENDYWTTLDTLYGYGYQTLFLDGDVDLTKLAPEFWRPSGVKVHVGKEQISGISEHDFTKGPVEYTVHVDDKLKNYQVTIAKKENGSKLFVNGPDTREIFLDEYFEYKHDVLIANIGDEELTGLTVELLDAVNVKLDDYWTVGGEKNDTLAAFSDIKTNYYREEMPNLAKIRLLPDGEGDITGTLKISADNQETVYIKLTGKAGNPKIITENLDDAVKYVPYSYVIATNNMHDWNGVTFWITEGKLPDGLQFYSATGEIYGTPLESGEFPITVEAFYSSVQFKPSYAEFTLTVKDNTNDNVYTASDAGYIIEEHIGTETAAGTHDYLLKDISNNQLFVSSGEYGEFIDLWLNGERLIDGEDYVKNNGSTRITIRSQTFREKARNGSNTIAAEFRIGGDKTKELKRTAQNFRLNLKQQNNGNNNSGNNTNNNHSHDDDDDDDDDDDSSNSSSSSSNNNKTSSNDNKNNNTTSYSDASWEKGENGWKCKKPDGSYLTNTWFQLPYRGTNAWYYFDEQGNMVTGWLQKDGKWYYLNPISDGSQGKMCTNWLFINGKWYFFKEDGSLVSNTWYQLPLKESMEWYYFTDQGDMATGWLDHNNHWYYLSPASGENQGKMATNWQFINDKWCYFNKDGSLMINTWHRLPYEETDEWYYFDEQGYMATGWLKNNGRWYYLNPVSDGEQGKMCTGWQYINDKWFYFNEEGDLVTDAWIGDYYVNPSGVWSDQR